MFAVCQLKKARKNRKLTTNPMPHWAIDHPTVKRHPTPTPPPTPPKNPRLYSLFFFLYFQKKRKFLH